LSDVFPIDKLIEESQNINDGKFRGEWNEDGSVKE